MSVMLYIEITTSEEKIEDGKPFGWRKKGKHLRMQLHHRRGTRTTERRA